MSLGTITIQSNDHADIFCVAPVNYNDVVQSDEEMFSIEDTQFDSTMPWVVGWLPKEIPVNVEGDSGILHAWFRGETYSEPFVIRVYVECELAEELEAVDEVKIELTEEADLEPQRVNL
jgi:hypothetical protein